MNKRGRPPGSVTLLWKCENCHFMTRSDAEAQRHADREGHALRKGDRRV